MKLPIDALAPSGETETFTRAFALGRLFQILEPRSRKNVSVAIRPDLVYAADLVCMATGYVVVSATDVGRRTRLALERA